MNKFYFVGYGNKRSERLGLSDLYGMEQVNLILDDVELKSPLKKELFQKAFRLRRIKDKDPFYLSFFDDCYILGNLEYESESTHYIIIYDTALTCRYSESFFRKLKNKHHNIRLILYIYDEMNRVYSPRLLRMSRLMDRTFCTIQSDCEKYGFEYWPLMHSNITQCVDAYEDNESTDIYFVGNDGGRLGTIQAIYQHLSSQGCKCDFYMAGDMTSAEIGGGLWRHRDWALSFR